MSLLGQGEYGSVKVVKVDDMRFALKETDLGVYPDDPEVVMACLREEAMNCEHKNIIKRYWCRFWNNTFQLCMEIGTPVGYADGKDVLLQIGQGLRFMHSQGFVHRDVKPENIVRVGNVLKLIDFGLTRKGDGRTKLTGYMITRWFRPPEMLRAKWDKIKYDGRVDMYSLGLTAYFLQNGRPLFCGDAEDILRQFEEFKPKATGLFKRLICDYDDRYTSEEMFRAHNIPLIPGKVTPVEERSGNVGTFVQHMINGREELASDYAHERIYSDL